MRGGLRWGALCRAGGGVCAAVGIVRGVGGTISVRDRAGDADIVGYAAEADGVLGVFEHELFFGAQADVQLRLASSFAAGMVR